MSFSNFSSIVEVILLILGNPKTLNLKPYIPYIPLLIPKKTLLTPLSPEKLYQAFAAASVIAPRATAPLSEPWRAWAYS